MGKNQFDKAKEFIEELKKENIIWGFEDFKLQIEKKLGNDKYRTVKPYLKLMLDTKLIVGEGENVRLC